MKRPPALVVVLALVLVAVLGAAAAVLLRQRTDDTANGSVPVRSLEDLTGHWAVVTSVGAPRPLAAPVELEVDGSRLLVRTGCNSGSGDASVDDSRLVLAGAGLAVTDMACDEPRNAQESWVIDMLSARPLLERSGPYLYVRWGTGEQYWLGLELSAASS
ncbi:META domain-containing protein [Phycicoccus sonneratiae]|uniref:META domain-containing protein n=1 Tax=Phycicoccus sonneratiae TaxID=2807628 RepID=A0ABS2CPB8_9MICO|nr:META domain-containing protein [Phycicoccus sonneraticus]MBM6401722.1 META domain-containing protein [Phycicoccus sonneraticus]